MSSAPSPAPPGTGEPTHPASVSGPVQLKVTFDIPAQLSKRQPCFVVGLDGAGQPIADLYIGHPITGQPVLVGMRRVIKRDPLAPDPFSSTSDPDE